MIKALFIRRFWLIQHRLLSTLGFMTLLPLFLHIAITMVMKNIFIYSLDEIQYEIWVFPGIIILISILSTYSVIYRDLFNLRIHKKAFIPITLAPNDNNNLAKLEPINPLIPVIKTVLFLQ